LNLFSGEERSRVVAEMGTKTARWSTRPVVSKKRMIFSSEMSSRRRRQGRQEGDTLASGDGRVQGWQTSGKVNLVWYCGGVDWKGIVYSKEENVDKFEDII
jgi:hypothetical protein